MRTTIFNSFFKTGVNKVPYVRRVELIWHMKYYVALTNFSN